jgi:hypothetical protein
MTENQEIFASQVNFASEQDLALAAAPMPEPPTDEEIDAMYDEHLAFLAQR